MTKLDGDARGGAALSVQAVTGKPILFVDRREARGLRRFHPDRMAQRILGMGDVLCLIEKAEGRSTPSRRRRWRSAAPRPVHASTTSSTSSSRSARWAADEHPRDDARCGQGAEERQRRRQRLDRVEAMILSMTPQERAHPDVITGAGAGASRAARGRTCRRSINSSSNTARCGNDEGVLERQAKGLSPARHDYVE